MDGVCIKFSNIRNHPNLLELGIIRDELENLFLKGIFDRPEKNDRVYTILMLDKEMSVSTFIDCLNTMMEEMNEMTMVKING